MALSAGPNITGPILEYSIYHYNYQLSCTLEAGESQESIQNTAVELLTLINAHQ